MQVYKKDNFLNRILLYKGSSLCNSTVIVLFDILKEIKIIKILLQEHYFDQIKQLEGLIIESKAIIVFMAFTKTIKLVHPCC